MGAPDIPPPPPPPPPPPAEAEQFDEGTAKKKKRGNRTGLKISIADAPGSGPNTPGASY